jgi:hypothetical protein
LLKSKILHRFILALTATDLYTHAPFLGTTVPTNRSIIVDDWQNNKKQSQTHIENGSLVGVDEPDTKPKSMDHKTSDLWQFLDANPDVQLEFEHHCKYRDVDLAEYAYNCQCTSYNSVTLSTAAEPNKPSAQRLVLKPVILRESFIDHHHSVLNGIRW